MKLLQLTAWAGKLGQQIINLIEAESPDLICLQEIIDSGDTMGFWVPLKDIAAISGYQVFFSPVFSFSFMRQTAKFGNAILSRWPIQKTNTIFTNSEHQENFSFEINDYNVRNLQHAIIKTPAGDINILDHHGYHVPSHKNGNAETLRQCKLIANYVDKLPDPKILTGDFNLSPSSESLKQINKVLDNLSVRYKLKTTRTPLTHKTEVCDYVFVSRGIKVREFRVSDEEVSDHMALILEFDI